MDFDPALIAVPFRMQPGLRRLATDAPQLTLLAPGSALWQEKQALLARGGTRLAVPGFDDHPVLAAIHARAVQEGLHPGATLPLELRFEQDFAVLDTRDGTLPWLAVSVPSRWAPEDKLGLPFAAVHAPVADNALLLAASQQLVALIGDGGTWERHVWTVAPSNRYDQHPRRHARTPWPQTENPMEFASLCWLRTERQTFFPVAGTSLAVFTIRVMLQPLTEWAAIAERAQRLHASLASMSDTVLAYKGLAPARDRLLRWLAAHAQ